MAIIPSIVPPTREASRRTMNRVSATVLMMTRPAVAVEGGKPELKAWFVRRKNQTKAGRTLPSFRNFRARRLRGAFRVDATVVME